MFESESSGYFQVGKVDPVPALEVAAIRTSGDRVHLPNLKIT